MGTDEGGVHAAVRLFDIPHGLVLRLWEGDGLRPSELFRDRDAMLVAQEQWREHAEAEGWRDSPR